MSSSARHRKFTSIGLRLLEDAEFAKTVLVVVTTVGCTVLFGIALFANFALK